MSMRRVMPGCGVTSVGLAAVLSAVLCAPLCLAQPEGEGEARRPALLPPGLRALQQETDPARARRALEAALAETRKLEEQLQQSIGRLDAGDAPADVYRALSEQRQAARQELAERGRGRGENAPRALRDRIDGPGERMEGRREGPPGRDAARPRFFRPGTFATLSTEERERLREDFRRDMPDVAADLERLRETDRATADQLFAKIAPRYHDAREARRVDPELGDLRMAELRGGVQVLRKMKAFREAMQMPESDAGRAQALAGATASLRQAMAEHFDQRMAVQQHEAENLARQLEGLREEIRDRSARKDELVERALENVRRGRPLRDGLGDVETGPGDRPPPSERGKAPGE